jgi:hypothetical protein
MMAELNPPSWLQNRTDHSAATDRALSDALTSGSAVVGINDLKVSQRAAGANMSVDVAGGLAFIEGTESATQGAYVVRADSTAINVTIAASNPTLPRIDLIVGKVQDAFYSGATNAWSVVAVTGTAAAGPVAPPAPNNAIILAQVSIAANAASVVNANITDKRVISWGRLYTGDLVCTSTTRPANPWQGLTIFETDTLAQYIWSGTLWLLLGKGGGQAYAMAAGTSTFTATGSAGPYTVAITFPAGRFTVNPYVFFGVGPNGGSGVGGAYAGTQYWSVTTSGATLAFVGNGAITNGTVVNIVWTAVQMTPTTANG